MRRGLVRLWAPVAAVVALVLCLAAPLRAQVTDGREAVESLEFEPLEFTPPVPEKHEVDGVTALLLQDRTLPLVTVIARFRGGYGLFDREWYAAGIGLPSLLRYGGTTSLAPDSVEELIEYYAMQTSFEAGGVGVGSTLNTLTDNLDVSLDLWWSLVTSPGFDQEQIDVWRGRQLEGVRRHDDDPGALAYSTFNRLLYGDHSIGWEMEESDLTPDRVTPARFQRMHDRIVCRDNMILGFAGDISWEDAADRVRRLVEAVPPCEEELPAAPVPEIRRGGGVFLVERDLEQAVVIMAHPTSVHLADDPEYFAATIGNSILGAGGFSSRIMQRVRSDEGYAYSASSLWTTPRRYDGLVGAITRTRPENVVPAVELILRTMGELRDAPPSAEELKTAVDRIVNGYVFNFQTPDQIVSRMMLYVSGELPEDWLERYAEGVQEVTPDDVQEVFAEHLRPDEMTILVVGDLDRIGRDALEELGPVTVLDAP
ncbi:MAG: pitrilysin family protein [Gemmatimonadota bacterium]|jgi:predicted Zn-dependent peptidase